MYRGMYQVRTAVSEAREVILECDPHYIKSERSQYHTQTLACKDE